MNVSMQHVGDNIHNAIKPVANDKNRRRILKTVSHGKEGTDVAAVSEAFDNKIGIEMMVDVKESIDNGRIVIGGTGLGLNRSERIIAVARKRNDRRINGDHTQPIYSRKGDRIQKRVE